MKYFNKILTVFLILVLIGISGCSNNSNDSESLNVKNDSSITYDKVIVAFGDSLTEGLGVERENAYPAQLERELINLGYNVKVYNSGSSGETSSGALARTDWVLQLNPDIVILGIGANDAIRGIDLDLTKQNIEKIVDKMQENNVTVILAGQIIFDNLGSDYVNQFLDIYPQIAKDKNIKFIPVFLEGVAANSSLNNPDQIHPNKEGYEIVVRENVLPVVVEVLENN
jgi:acyl-CoA thioesterase-1